jgi:cytochrome c-type biogenesis protein CcmH/NrfG
MTTVPLLPPEVVERLISEGKIDKNFLEREQKALAVNQEKSRRKTVRPVTRQKIVAVMAAAALVAGISALVWWEVTHKQQPSQQPKPTTRSIYGYDSMRDKTPYWATPK